MSEVIIVNEPTLFHRIAVPLRMGNDRFIGPFAMVHL